MSKKAVLSGNEAIARAAIESGVSVASAYPGTPSTEIMQYIAANSELHAEWAVNEKVALETAIGASYSGVRSIACMKHVGLNVASDPLMTLAYTGINGGLLIVVADDPGMHSSQNEQDSRYYAKFAKIFCFEPSDAVEAKEMVKEAFIISEETELPVMLRTLTRISHTGMTVSLDKIEKQRNPALDINRSRWVMVPANARARHKILNEKQKDLVKLSENSSFNRVIKADSKIGVIACGLAYSYVMEFFDADFNVLKIGTYPLPEKLIEKFIRDKEKIIILEEGEPFVEDYVKCLHNNVFGKRTGDIALEGELSPELVAKILGIKLERGKISKIDLPPRPPVMCAGCPHRGTYYALKQNDIDITTSDIGCYTLGVQKPLEAIDTCLCMGASISQGAGMSQSGIANVVSVIGESTFLHSGITALLSAVYNGADILLLILDNSTVAMTGHQPTPASGTNIRGEKTDPASIVDICWACGAKSVDILDPYNVDEMKKKIDQRLDEKGVKVIIARRPCAILKGVKRGKPYKVNDCKACRKCLTLGCPAISFDEEKNSSIISFLCTGCGICEKVCPFDAIKRK